MAVGDVNIGSLANAVWQWQERAEAAEAENDRLRGELDQARTRIGDMEASYANALQEMSERFRAVNISRVIEQSGVDFIAQAAKLQAAESEATRLRGELARVEAAIRNIATEETDGDPWDVGYKRAGETLLEECFGEPRHD